MDVGDPARAVGRVLELGEDDDLAAGLRALERTGGTYAGCATPDDYSSQCHAFPPCGRSLVRSAGCPLGEAAWRTGEPVVATPDGGTALVHYRRHGSHYPMMAGHGWPAAGEDAHPASELVASRGG